MTERASYAVADETPREHVVNAYSSLLNFRETYGAAAGWWDVCMSPDVRPAELAALLEAVEKRLSIFVEASKPTPRA